MASWMLCLLLSAAIPGQGECTAVFFTSPRCEPCQQVAPALQKLMQEGWDVRTVNAPENTDLAAQYRIDTLPTVVIVGTKSRREIDRVVGVVSYEQLEGRFRRAAARFSNVPLADKRSTGSATVRGQSPTPSGGFPMLAGNVAAVTATASAVADRLSSAGTVPAQVASRLRDEDRQFSSSTLQPSQVQPAQVQPAMTIEQAIARAAAATVRIKIEEASSIAYGTGTIVDVHNNEALVLTCGHMFRDLAPGSLMSVDLFAGTPREQSVEAELVEFRADDEDIGLISFKLPFPIEPVELLPASEALSVGQAAFSFGCDHGQPPTRRDTQVRHINRFLGSANVEIAGAPVVGRSGGGLFDVQGRLIGVCNGADNESNQGVYAAADVIYAQIGRAGLQHLFQGPNTTAGTTVASGADWNRQVTDVASSMATSADHDSLVMAASHSFSDTSANDMTASNMTTAGLDRNGINGDAIGGDGIEWPDQKTSQTQGSLAQSTSSEEIICIVRNSAGESKIVTIPRPSPELLRAIEQHNR